MHSSRLFTPITRFHSASKRGKGRNRIERRRKKETAVADIPAIDARANSPTPRPAWRPRGMRPGHLDQATRKWQVSHLRAELWDPAAVADLRRIARFRVTLRKYWTKSPHTGKSVLHSCKMRTPSSRPRPSFPPFPPCCTQRSQLVLPSCRSTSSTEET